ncbi:NTP transferase domain-containing protein [Mucilaginibacter sp. UR6-1]|uniref:NTP transferase domain-containing protein n=1 Tax=Mucilaginibacter sp. UR6-1 TaxID=1435643 RepID=UPI001E3E2661|nr:NTP transferase domain-containing protein [Mucilaginibacter sp. UR6-1]MCC8410090.1 NTP transferase domain-containing protein [Mucilaginibacter sp. UR6-1]
MARPSLGNFGRSEWAILGAPCTVIKLLADDVIKGLAPDYKGAYADTTHTDDMILPPGRLNAGAVLEYTDQLQYSQLSYAAPLSPFQLRQHFSQADFVLVNGNHQQAKAQVLVLDENKKASLQKRAANLTNVELILVSDNTNEVFDFVQDAVLNWRDIPMLKVDDLQGIITFFKGKLIQNQPKLNGLVLAGGKSQRMGFDKTAVKWHGKEQRYHVADMLRGFCSNVYISCRAEQQDEVHTGYAVLPDTFTDLGPYGAILSAFRSEPDSAWLVVATDLPLLDETTIQHLIALRNPAAIATAYTSTFDGLPEPLITIWEPKSYPQLLAFLAQGYSCPRKVLINSDTSLIPPANPDALTNVNTPDEHDRIKLLLHQKIASHD